MDIKRQEKNMAPLGTTQLVRRKLTEFNKAGRVHLRRNTAVI